MTTRRRTTESPLQRAWSALHRMEEPIQWDEIRGQVIGAEDVEAGLDALATALSKLKGLNLGAAPLDQVLAEMGEDDLVEAATELIQLVGRATYTGGPSREEIEPAETCRDRLCNALDNLLTKLEEEQADD